eukprot:TRINITY_DN8413_c0_g1_i2.p1 TRINITY_DN8413_c0_g1~~TRINITY_DN8413_c0_g1_i2.p1  ORF type:complete len:948 (-),score=375.69 TRINITY_DN8413_c0_g1_i2:1130-3973(-)
MSITAAVGLLQGLKETDVRFRVHALKKIQLIIDEHWAEIADALMDIEELYEDQGFPERELAALIASKVYYHMEQYDEALRLALESGSKFDINEKSAYVERLISKCIDDYTSKRVRNAEAKSEEEREAIDPKLEEIVNRMFERCLRDGEYYQTIGIALEARRTDMIEQAIRSGEYIDEKLNYTYSLAEKSISSKEFRTEVLELLVRILKERLSASTYYFDLSRCYVSLNNAAELANLLSTLQLESSDSALVALQLAFDLFDSENQQLTSQVCIQLKARELAESDPEKKKEITRLVEVITGKYTHELYMQFLSKNNKTDSLIVTDIKESIPQTVSALQEACIWCNGIMNACTTDDSFLKNNLDWISKTSNWAKFSCCSTLGSIHKGNTANAMVILEPYLNPSHANSNPYSGGGAFYALGLIHANQYNAEVMNTFFSNMTSLGKNDVICHGICLGYGLVGMATGDEAVYSELKTTMFEDSAVRGQAAALAAGLIMLGTGNQDVISDLLTYAHETQHEKIIREISLSLAFIMYGKEEAADELFEKMASDKDAIIRYGAMYLLGMAYVGTGNKIAIRKLLHYGVSDVDNDVRRSAVTNLGFVMARNPEKLPRMVAQLADSYNPFVRYGAAMALGICCSGSANTEALNILVPLLGDNNDFVRQGAIIAIALVLMQVTTGVEPQVADLKKHYDQIYKDKHEDILCRFGAIVAKGILEAGGRNCLIQLISRLGSPRITTVVGLVVFNQFWYWFPYINFLSLALTPTALLGINADIKMPASFSVISNMKPSMFAYPAPIVRETMKKPEKIQSAILSITRRAEANARKREETKGATGPAKKEVKKEEEKKEEKKEDAKDAKKEEPEQPEPDTETIENGRRILPQQKKYLRLNPESRYIPLAKDTFTGILVLQDTEPGKPESYVGEVKKESVKKEEKDVEMRPPEEFIYDPVAQEDKP